MARLRVEAGRDEGTTVEVIGEIVIGRDEDCDLVLHDEQVSRRHATLSELPDGSLVVTDLGSSNGTLVAGTRIEGSVELQGSVRIRIGDSVISVEADAPRTVLAERGVTLRI